MMPAMAMTIPVYLATGPTDMRKSINGLSLEVSEYFDVDIFSRALFAFCNRNRNLVKVLYWDANSFCLWTKQLQRGCFKWPQEGEDVLYITSREFGWLLSGLELKQAEKLPQNNYRKIS